MSFNTNITNVFDTDSGNLYQLDHRRFAVQNCDAKAASRRQALDASKQTGLISGLGKLAGIEGTGVVQEALDAIVSTVHVGGPEFEKLVNGGVEGLMTSILGSQATNFVTGALNDMSPHAVNQAKNAAQQIYDKIKNKDFDWRDIPQYTADFKNLYTLGTEILNPFLSNNAPNLAPVTACSASPYATDIMRYGVKFKFLFVAQINFRKNYLNLMNIDPSFLIKTSDRPTVTYEYEDINTYNFHTKIAKRSTFEPVKMTFYDDDQNTAVSFYNAMLRLMSPKTNNRSELTVSGDGMNFGDLLTSATGRDSGTQGIPGYIHGASVGPLLGTDTSIIESIDLFHVYSGGQKVNQYRFLNPRIVTLGLDELDMSSEGVTEMQLEFAYDAIEITNAVSMTNITGGHIDMRPGFRYPLGGPNPFPSETEIASVSPTSSPKGLAERYAAGEAFIEGGIGTMVGGISQKLSNVFGAVTAPLPFVSPPPAVSYPSGVSYTANGTKVVNGYVGNTYAERKVAWQAEYPNADPRLLAEGPFESVTHGDDRT